MKKTIFDLSYDEGKKIDAELRKTSYYKQYYMGYVLCILFVILGSLIFVLSPLSDQPSSDLYIIVGVIAICFICLFTLLFHTKRFDLVHQYYLEKEKNK